MKNANGITLITSVGAVIALLIAIVFYTNKENNMRPTKEFNKVFIPNTKIYNQIQEHIDKMLYRYNGVDRINIVNFHNGSEDIRQVPFLKESIQMKSLKNEEYDIREDFKNYPIENDLFKINYLYDNGILIVDSNYSQIPKPFKAQLDKFKVKRAVYHALISNEGIWFGYLSLENVGSKGFQFLQKDSISFMKDIAEIEILFDKLLRENKSSYISTYVMVLSMGFGGFVLLFMLIGFILQNKVSSGKIDSLVDFIKPKFEIISNGFELMADDLKAINRRVVFLEKDRKNNSQSSADALTTALEQVEEVEEKLGDMEKRLYNIEHKAKKN